MAWALGRLLLLAGRAGARAGPGIRPSWRAGGRGAERWRPRGEPLRAFASRPAPPAAGAAWPVSDDVRQTFREMLERETGVLQGLPTALVNAKPQHQAVNAALKDFQRSSWASNQAISLYVNSSLWGSAAAKFRKFVLRAITPDVVAGLVECGGDRGRSDRLLFPLFASFVLERFAAEVAEYRVLSQSADLRFPHRWYPLARSMKRKLIYHAGPTNSGKTYNALLRMKQAPTGVYCGPLRLLAMEVYDTCNLEGVMCNLITGQERRELPYAMHQACTIEMVNTTKGVDVAVVDEIQMIANDQRGWAWTRAVQGIPAREVHLCGDASAVPIIEDMARTMGDELEVCEYDRITPLTVERRAMDKGYRNVKAGDCVVAFSRRDIYNIKREIEKKGRERCCVIYGKLPPETRRQQAHLFNDPDSGYNVLVASDAVGMGLNLNMRRVIFHTLEKFTGTEMVTLSSSQAKQIAGRAGRRNSGFKEGLVATRSEEETRTLEGLLEAPQAPIKEAGLFPTFEQIELFASLLPDEPFSKLLQRFAKESKVDGKYFLCKHDDLLRLARILDQFPALSLKDVFHFAQAPVNSSDAQCVGAFTRYVKQYSEGAEVDIGVHVGQKMPQTASEMSALEIKHHVVSLWLWLSHRFDQKCFAAREEAEQLLERICLLLDAGLKNHSEDAKGRPLRVRRGFKRKQKLAKREGRSGREQVALIGAAV